MVEGQDLPYSAERGDPKARQPLPTSRRQMLRKSAMIALYGSVSSVLFYIYLYYSETGHLPNVQKNAVGFVVALFISILVSAALYASNLLLDRWVSWMSYFNSRFVVGFISNVVIALTLVIVSTRAVTQFVDPDIAWNGSTPNDPDVIWKITILIIVFVFTYNVIYAILYAYQHYAVAQIEEVKRDRKQLELQFEALKGQISPHYLFNSLNTISSLLLKDIQSAEQFIRRLAETYQYVLSTQNKKYVCLRDEVDFVQSYYYLLRIRFQQQLHVEINIPAKILNTRIPPLTLQMLIENAVKHNNFSGDEKLFIYIMAQDNTYLKVINTKTELFESIPSFKVGLENIRQRYHFLTDKQVVVENKDKFIVSLPVLSHSDQDERQKNSA